MNAALEWLINFTSDKFFFIIFEGLYFSFFIFSLYMSYWYSKGSGIKAGVIRGENSMKKLHGAFVTLSFIFVLLTVNVEIVQNHIVIWLIINIGLLAYLCYFNPWFRNKLMTWVKISREAENL